MPLPYWLDRTPSPADAGCTHEQIRAMLALRARVLRGEVGMDDMSSLDLRRVRFVQYLRARGVFTEGFKGEREVGKP